ncbi:glycoside hydrolase family 32 protein [Ectobacillus funiculus]|uniref:beta-fructofuranosidase n=2 Tax=Ectobacillus funiculus TaxID=137993 RepID=A0ABV5WC40_9BACI
MRKQGVLIFSPQGIEAENDKYQNIYQTGCLVGDPLNLETLQFNHGEFQELDLGFDFYAAQTMISPDGRRILSAWMGLPEINYPTEKFGYCGCLTIPRELTLKEGKLIQQPIKELKQLRYNHKRFQKILTSDERFMLETGAMFELEIILEMKDPTELRFGIRADQKNEAKTLIHIDKNKSEVIIDRSQSGAAFATEYGNTRKIAGNISDEIKLQIFVDQSSIEIFINDGEIVASSRIFPNEDQNYLFIETINGKSAIQLDYWRLKDSNEELKATTSK